MKLPDELKKLLASLGGGKLLQQHVEQRAREVLGEAEVQAYLGARISANFLELVGSGLFQQPAILTMAQAVSESLVESVSEITAEHDQTCKKDHSGEVRAFNALKEDITRAFDKCRDTLNKKGAHARAERAEEDGDEEKDEEEADGGSKGVKLEDIKLEQAPLPEKDLIAFDGLMKSAIQKARSKKPFKAEVESLVTLLDTYKGGVEIMRKAQELIAGKATEDKLVAITKFVKSVA